MRDSNCDENELACWLSEFTASHERVPRDALYSALKGREAGRRGRPAYTARVLNSMDQTLDALIERSGNTASPSAKGALKAMTEVLLEESVPYAAGERDEGLFPLSFVEACCLTSAAVLETPATLSRMLLEGAQEDGDLTHASIASSYPLAVLFAAYVLDELLSGGALGAPPVVKSTVATLKSLITEHFLWCNGADTFTAILQGGGACLAQGDCRLIAAAHRDMAQALNDAVAALGTRLVMEEAADSAARFLRLAGSLSQEVAHEHSHLFHGRGVWPVAVCVIYAAARGMRGSLSAPIHLRQVAEAAAQVTALVGPDSQVELSLEVDAGTQVRVTRRGSLKDFYGVFLTHVGEYVKRVIALPEFAGGAQEAENRPPETLRAGALPSPLAGEGAGGDGPGARAGKKTVRFAPGVTPGRQRAPLSPLQRAAR